MVLDAGCGLLTGGLDGGGAAERDVLWLLESAVGIAHAVLWHLAQSGLVERHDTALFKCLVRLYVALPALPGVSLDLASVAMHWHESPPAPKPGTVTEAAHAVEAALLRG